MPARSDKVLELQEQSGEYELPYISKSRAKQWLENPEHFRLKYLEDIREPETEAMVRGTRIHRAFEEFYRAMPQDNRVDALPDRKWWADFIEPYVSNFLNWEERRWQHADGVMSDYLPVAVEEEHWRDPLLGIDGEPEWMGLADAILPSAGVPASPSDDGMIIVDFKTGSVPDPQYRSPGIYTELEYYVMLFEDKYPVTGAGAYYPKEDTFILQPETESYRGDVIDAVREMVEATNRYEGDTQFEIKQGPLCKWGTEPHEESSYYGVCSQCSWGAPANNENQFKALVEEGTRAEEIADRLGCSTDAVYYWKHKMNL